MVVLPGVIVPIGTRVTGPEPFSALAVVQGTFLLVVLAGVPRQSRARCRTAMRLAANAMEMLAIPGA